MVRVLLADNHAVVRDGIRGVLAQDTSIQVVDEATDFSQAITKAQKLRPEVLIVDLHMPFEPNLSLRELAVQLKCCGTVILGISFANDDDARSLATEMGAAELLDKVQLGKVLIPAILRVASTCCPPPAEFVKTIDRRAL